MQAANAFLTAFPAFISIINPISASFIFHARTSDRSEEERRMLARKVGVFSFVVLIGALWAGSNVLSFFGVSLAALRVAGGLVVALNAWETLTAPERREARKQEQGASREGASAIAFYPLTMPLTTGPGTISVAVALGATKPPIGPALPPFLAGVSAAAALAAVTVWATFTFAGRVQSRLNPSVVRTITRLFAFLLLCIGTQILIHGVEDVLRPMLKPG
ncbi:MAG: MarC family protein [Acetobacteraceae bacterium]|nr:MarC family protein [Acetobacteraceae bacterium]